MRRYRGTIDILVGIEHRMKKEEMKEQINKETKQCGGQQMMRRESLMTAQAVRNASTRGEELLRQLTVIWEW